MRYANVGTGIVTFDVIMRPENEISHNSYLAMRHLRQERLLTTGCSVSVAIPNAMIVATPRNVSGNE